VGRSSYLRGTWPMERKDDRRLEWLQWPSLFTLIVFLCFNVLSLTQNNSPGVGAPHLAPHVGSLLAIGRNPSQTLPSRRSSVTPFSAAASKCRDTRIHASRFIKPLYENTSLTRADGAPIPPELTDWLIASQDFRPGKQMSQIYLADESVATDVVEAARVTPTDLIIEIGAGGGSLTRALVKAGAYVLAVEAVSSLASELDKFFDKSHVRVVNADFLKLDLDKLVATEIERRPGHYKSVKVISNLPYHITTPVLQKVLPMNHLVETMVLMLQHEAAKRFASALPSERDYRFMNFFVNYYSNATYRFKVGRHCYRPNPGVPGGVIEFNLQERNEIVKRVNGTSESLLSFAKLAFQAKRKTLRQTLNGFNGYTGEYIETVLDNLGLSKLARAEELDFETMVELYNALEGRTIKAVPRPVEPPKKLNWTKAHLNQTLWWSTFI